MRTKIRTDGRQTISYKYVFFIYVAPPGDDTLHRGPVDERDRLIFTKSMASEHDSSWLLRYYRFGENIFRLCQNCILPMQGNYICRRSYKYDEDKD